MPRTFIQPLEAALFIPRILENFANDYYSHIFCSVREALKQTPVIFALMSFLLLMNIEGLGLGRVPLSGFKLQLRLG